MRAAAASGRYIRAAPIREGETSFDLAPDATLRAALCRHFRECGAPGFAVAAGDLRKKVYKRPRKTLILFLVDASDSMGEGTHARIRAAKGAVLAILAKAYQKRHRVGLVAFREETAELVLPPTSSLTLARTSLQALPTGGATPFAGGLMKAWRVIRTERLKDPGIRPLLVMLSDGEANVPYEPSCPLSRLGDELLAIGGRIGRDNIASIAIDTAPLHNGAATMRRLAEVMAGSYHHISRLKGGGMVRLVAGF